MDRKKRNSLIIIIVVSIIAIIGLIMVKNHNPEEANFFIPCMFNKVTGLKCPGCGMTRAIHEILHFNFFQSIKYNILALPLVVLGIISTPVIIYDIIFNKNIFINL